jgi:hypothetical protein
MSFKNSFTLTGSSQASHEANPVPGNMLHGSRPKLKSVLIGCDEVHGLNEAALRAFRIGKNDREPPTLCILSNLMLFSIVPRIRSNTNLFDVVYIKPLRGIGGIPENLR